MFVVFMVAAGFCKDYQSGLPLLAETGAVNLKELLAERFVRKNNQSILICSRSVSMMSYEFVHMFHNYIFIVTDRID